MQSIKTAFTLKILNNGLQLREIKFLTTFVCSKTKIKWQQNQYLVGYPFLYMTLLHLLSNELVRFRISFLYIVFKMSWRPLNNTEVFLDVMSWTLFFIRLNKFSLGFKSGDYPGHGSTFTPCSLRQLKFFLEV